jgi:hypothetical protein
LLLELHVDSGVAGDEFVGVLRPSVVDRAFQARFLFFARLLRRSATAARELILSAA